MQLNSLYLKNYRNQEDLTLDFHGKNTLITGRNGAGKTSILEAITTLSTTKSFKAKKEIDVIMHDHATSLIKAVRLDGEDPIDLAIAYEKIGGQRVTKKYFVDEVSKRASHMIGKLLTVLFTTDLINNFGDSAATRRRIFNQFLSELDKEYLAQLTTLEKVLKNKRKLLAMVRDGSDSQQLMYWNTELVQLSTQIIQKRHGFIMRIQAFLYDHQHDKNFLNRNIKISYISPYLHNDGESEIQTILTDELLRLTNVEIESGRCLVGPHRDDYDVFFDEKNIKHFASRGEQKFAMSLLLYAVARYIDDSLHTAPLILLDDLSAEMDEKNIASVLKLFNTTGFQVIATAIHTQHYPIAFENTVVL